MKTSPRYGCAVALAALLWAAPAPARYLPAADFGPRLQRALARGELGPNRAALLGLYAALAPERLPAEYRVALTDRPGARKTGTGALPAFIRCGTPAVLHVLSRLERMPPEMRSQVAELLPGPAVGAGSPAPGAGKVTPDWHFYHEEEDEKIFADRIETANFSVEWIPSTLTNEDGTTPPRDDDSNGVPDVVELWAAYLEASLARMGGILRPDDPPSAIAGTFAETQRIPVAVTPLSPGLYGLTSPVEGGDVVYMEVNSDFSFLESFGIENDASRAYPDDPLANIHGAMRVTAAHELFHVLQFAYEPAYAGPDYHGTWWWEATTTWIEDEIFDEVNDYLNYFAGAGLGGWADYAEAGLFIPQPVSAYPPSRVYGGVVFSKYLQEHVGGRRMIGQVWDLIRLKASAVTAIDSIAREHGYADPTAPPREGFCRLYLGFAAANAAMELEYRDGARYGRVSRRGDTLDAADVTENLPAYVGTTYREQAGDGAGPLELLLSGAAREAGTAEPGAVEVLEVPWGLSLLVRRANPDRALILGDLDPLGAPALSLAAFDPAATATAGVSLLSPGTEASSYSLTVAAPATLVDLAPPTAVADLEALAVPGGLDASWAGAEDDVAVAGYVVRAEHESGGGALARTLFGSITSIELRGLAVGRYALAVAAYDTAGNEGPEVRLEGFAVEEEEPLTPTPMPVVEKKVIARSGKGSRGVGRAYGFDKICFIDSLGW